MTYTIELSRQANDEIDSAFSWLVQQTVHAFDWYDRVLKALHSLEQIPHRCPLAPEYRGGREVVRHLIVGDKIHGYRIIFTIHESTVYVIDFLHGAREK